MQTIAIIDPNTLSIIGLRQLLQAVVPGMEVEVFGSFEALEATDNGQFAHYFAAQTIVLEHPQYFLDRIRQTLVLTTSHDPQAHLGRFKSLCTSVPEEQLVKRILQMQQRGHSGGRNLPQPEAGSTTTLSNREIEVLSLIVQGLINKEVAARLNISLTTVITHRKNIVEKLGLRSLSALTIYAVMHGYVDISNI